MPFIYEHWRSDVPQRLFVLFLSIFESAQILRHYSLINYLVNVANQLEWIDLGVVTINQYHIDTFPSILQIANIYLYVKTLQCSIQRFIKSTE